MPSECSIGQNTHNKEPIYTVILTTSDLYLQPSKNLPKSATVYDTMAQSLKRLFKLGISCPSWRKFCEHCIVSALPSPYAFKSIQIAQSPPANSVVELVKTSALVSRRSWVQIPPENTYSFFHHRGSWKHWVYSAYKFTSGRARSPQFKFITGHCWIMFSFL